MKRSVTLILGLLIFLNANAQENELLDEFRRINLELLDEAYDGSNTDSAKCMQLIAIAQRLNNDSLFAIGYNYLAFFYDSSKGDNTTAFEYYYKALPLAIQAKDKRRISSIYFDIATGLFDLKNYEEALRNTQEGNKNLPKIDHPRYNWMLIQFYNSMATYHALNDNADSAFYYGQRTLEINNVVKSIGMEYNALSIIAHYYSLKEDFINADHHFQKAKILTDSIDLNQSVLGFTTLFIPHLLKQGKYKEIELEARKSILEGRRDHNNHQILAGAKYLRIFFEESGNVDSAYFYSRLESETNSLIYNQGNLNKIHSIKLGESLRQAEEENQKKLFENKLRTNTLLGSSVTLILIAALLYWNGKNNRKSKDKIEKAYSVLKSTQSQLIHSEKMASLGELTAGIAHEIQNPLNFVNNFSEVNKEMLDELKEAVEKNDQEEVNAILNDLKENEDKVAHHGKRAEGIVKSMLQHSRTGSGEKEETDINALCDEYLRLAYHGFRAKNKSFNSEFELDLDPTLPKVNVVSQDLGRVLLNLINNAFQATSENNDRHSERSKESSEADGHYSPQVIVTTKKTAQGIQITISDNGPGIPDDIKDKIFEPFFTTKPTGEGTGLGLSMSYDIVTKGHGGELKVESHEGKGTEFRVILSVE